MINVMARFAVKEGREAQFEEAIAIARPQMMADSGCLRYDLQKSRRSSTDYVLLESYDSKEAIQRHGELEAFRAFGEAVKDLLEGEPEVVFLAPVGDQVDAAG